MSPNSIRPRAKRIGVPVVLFLSEIQLPRTESLYVIGCTAEPCSRGNQDIKRLQALYWERRGERFSEAEKEMVYEAHRYFREATDTVSGCRDVKSKVEGLVQRSDIFQTSCTTVRVQGSALSTNDMEDRDRCHGCRVLNIFNMPYERPLSQSTEQGGPYHPLSCGETLVMALLKRYRAGS